MERMASRGRNPERDDRKILPSLPERSNSTTVRNNGSRVGRGGDGDVTKDVRNAIKADIRKSLRQAIGDGSAGDTVVESRDDVMVPPTSSPSGNRRTTITITSSAATQPIKELVFRVESELGLLPPPPPNPTSLERVHIDSPSITSTIRTTASRHTLASRHTSASRHMSASRHTTKRYSTPRPPPPSSADVVKSREFAADIDSEPPSLSPPMSPVKSASIGKTSKQLSASTAKFDHEPSIRVNDSTIEDYPVDESVASPAGVRKHLKAALVSPLYSRPVDTKTRITKFSAEEDIKPDRCEGDELLNLALLCDPDDTNFDPFQITSIPTDEIVDAVVNEPTIEDTNARSFDEEMIELAARETRDQYQLGRLQTRINQRRQITNPISPKQFTPSFKTLRSSRIKTTRTMLNQNQSECNDTIANSTTNSTPELAVNTSATIQSLQRGTALGPSMTSSSSGGNKSVTSSSMISTHCDTAQRGKLYAKMMGLLNDVSPDGNQDDNMSNMKKTMINENKASGFSVAELKLIDEHIEEEMTRTLQVFEQNNSLVRSTPSTKAGTKDSEAEVGTILDFKIPELEEYQSDTILEFTYQNHKTPSITTKFSDVTSPTVHAGFEEDEIILPPQQSPRVASSPVTSPGGQSLKVVTYLGGGQSSLKVKVPSSPLYTSPLTSPSTVASLSPVAAAAAEAAVAEAVKYAMLQKLKREEAAKAKAKAEEAPVDANVTEITTVRNANAEMDKLDTNIELNEMNSVVKPPVDDLTSLFSPMQGSTSVATRNQNDDEQPLLEEEKVDVYFPIAATCPSVMNKSDILGMMEQCKSLLIDQENNKTLTTGGMKKVNNSNTKQKYFHESLDNGFDELQKVTSFLLQREDELMNKANNKKGNKNVDQPLFVVNFAVKSESLEGEMNDVRNFDDDILPNNQQATFGCGVLDIFWFSKFSK